MYTAHTVHTARTVVKNHRMYRVYFAAVCPPCAKMLSLHLGYNPNVTLSRPLLPYVFSGSVPAVCNVCIVDAVCSSIYSTCST